MILIKLMLLFIIVLTLFITHGLLITRDGNLRKILILYFTVEFIIWSIVLYLAINFDFKLIIPMSIYHLLKVVLITILILKSTAKGVFYFYIAPKGRGQDLSKHT